MSEMTPRIGSLFSGAGGLDLAVKEVFGGQFAWHAEVDSAASKVLNYRFPNVPNLGDITAVNWDDVPVVDVLCGGWPCQPFSLAGRQRGSQDERALWPYVERAVRHIRPKWVVLENVAAVISDGELARAVSDLSACGYDAQWLCLRASEVGAPHHRERVFVVANATGVRFQTPEQRPVRHAEKRSVAPCGGVSLPNAGEGQWDRYQEAVTRWEKLTRPAPNPVVEFNGRAVIATAFVEWMMGWPEGWVTEVPGLNRNDHLKICGNGVVPQQAQAAIQWLVELASAEAPHQQGSSRLVKL